MGYTRASLRIDAEEYNKVLENDGCGRRYMVGGGDGYTYVYSQSRLQYIAGSGSITGTVGKGTAHECYKAMVADAGWAIAETRQKKIAALEDRIVELKMELEAERG